MQDTRSRLWSFIIYPKSIKYDWREYLDDLHIEWCESPLHDKDLNADGELKKEHIHLLLFFDGVKSFDQIKSITDYLSSPIPQRCHSAKGLIRYFCHLDNPEKYQYSKDQIIGHNGFDPLEYLKLTSSNRYQIIKDMIEYVISEGVTEVIQLVQFAMIYHYDDWFPLLCDNSMVIMQAVIKSNRYNLKFNYKE